jgi:hypothetical protein
MYVGDFPYLRQVGILSKCWGVIDGVHTAPETGQYGLKGKRLPPAISLAEEYLERDYLFDADYRITHVHLAAVLGAFLFF